MSRPVASLAILALSWAQLVALHCDMGAAAVGDAHHEMADEAASGPQGGHHGDSHGCLMILACGSASVRTAQTVAVKRIPADFIREDFFVNPIPVAADLAVETPPPRQAI